MSRRACLACLAIAPLVAACGGGGLPDGGTPANSAEGFTLTARAGLYETGGRRGLALVATLRDGAGRGPATPWSMTLRPPSGDVIALVYDDGSDGSFQAWWWESVEPATGPFQLTAQGTHSTITLPFEIADRAGLAPPRPGLTPDGNAIAWEAPAGAVAYACRFYAGPALAATTSPSPEARCDLGGLGDGSYTASVLAFTVDLAGLAADRGPAPALPAGFHVAQGRFGFVRGTGTVGHQLRTAGGALNFGTTAGGLALWIALGTPDGKPPAESWTVSVVGPGMSPSAPLTAVYPAGAAQRLLWSYDLLPRVDRKSVV